MGLPSLLKAQAAASAGVTDQDDPNEVGGYAKPYEYERQANGYDPEGFEYKENQIEDFQVVFITSTPFTAFASFGIYATFSLATQGAFIVGDNFVPFVITALAGSTVIACVSVLSNDYPPPNTNSFVDVPNQGKKLAFEVPLVTAKF